MLALTRSSWIKLPSTLMAGRGDRQALERFTKLQKTFIYSVLRHRVLFCKNRNFNFWDHVIFYCKKKRIHNLRFAKNIDLNHKSMHDSVYLTNLFILDIVFVILYHTHHDIDIVRYVMVWWKFKSNTKVLIIVEKVFWYQVESTWALCYRGVRHLSPTPIA